jgi:hypothetical protein
MNNLIPIDINFDNKHMSTIFNTELSVEHNIGQYLRELFITHSLTQEKDLMLKWALTNVKCHSQVFSKDDVQKG